MMNKFYIYYNHDQGWCVQSEKYLATPSEFPEGTEVITDWCKSRTSHMMDCLKGNFALKEISEREFINKLVVYNS